MPRVNSWNRAQSFASSVPGLVLCGDSCFPGIGVPAVAGSGLLAAHATGLKTLEPTLGEMRLDGFSMVTVVVSINFCKFKTNFNT